jgi:acetyltransferase-like isoleucine patch superfamily enzyme
MKSWREFLMNRKSGLEAHELSAWGWKEMVSLTLLLLARFVRGVVVRLQLKKSCGVVLCERMVRIYHPWHIIAGTWLNLEEGCEIVGLSKRGIVFGNRCTVGRSAVIRPTNVLLDEAGEGLRLGDNSNIGAFSYIGCSGYIDIGRRVMMGPRVNLLSENHAFNQTDVPIQLQGVVRSEIHIADDCWLGAGCTVLAGVSIGRGSVIGAGAVVTHDIPENSIAVGVPARVIRSRVG